MGTTTGLSAQQQVFNRLISAGVKNTSALTGGIYQMLRPKDSLREDIVVGVLTMSAEQVQEGVFNVNIHVPNLKLKNDSTQPDIERFKVITAAVVAALGNFYGFDYNFDVSTTGIPYRDGTDWFVNVRVIYTSLRTIN